MLTRFFGFSLLSTVLAAAQAPQFVVGYYQESSSFPLTTLVSNHSAAGLTHLNYAFAKIVAYGSAPNDTYACVPADPGGELGPGGVFQQILALKSANPKLKVLISVGGALGSGYFSAAAIDDKHRGQFAQSCIDQFIDGQFASPAMQGVFDGIDIDWEFPLNDPDPANYNALLNELRTRLDSYQAAHPGSQRLLLTSAISPRNGPDTLQNITFSGSSGAAGYVDFFNVMSYDYAGSWNNAPASTAPLAYITNNVSDLISRWGIPANKMVLGIPFYGVHYGGNFASSGSLSTLLSEASNSPVSDASGWGTQDTNYVNIASTVAGRQAMYDSDQSAWFFDGTYLWAYDDATTIAHKASFAQTQGLAGLMTWDISKDTSAGALLCAMETGMGRAVGCGTASAPPPPNPGILLFDFEQSVQGWTYTGNVYTAYSSANVANTGSYSLAALFSAGSYQPHGTVYVTPPPSVHRGSIVQFNIWVPGEVLSSLGGITAFFMDSNWSWTANGVNLVTLTPNAWNTISVTVPPNAAPPFTEVGIQFDLNSGWDGRIYVDTVTVR